MRRLIIALTLSLLGSACSGVERNVDEVPADAVGTPAAGNVQVSFTIPEDDTFSVFDRIPVCTPSKMELETPTDGKFQMCFHVREKRKTTAGTLSARIAFNCDCDEPPTYEGERTVAVGQLARETPCKSPKGGRSIFILVKN